MVQVERVKPQRQVAVVVAVLAVRRWIVRVKELAARDGAARRWTVVEAVAPAVRRWTVQVAEECVVLRWIVLEVDQ